MRRFFRSMSHVLAVALCLLLTSTAFAGPEANTWYFGSNAGLDFSSGTPVALTNGALNTSEGCATISDSTGQLLFYSDGRTVYNRNHGAMANGTGLRGDSSSTQSAVVVPVFGSQTQYYLFTVGTYTSGVGLRYSIVDMALNNGLGDVTATKDVVLDASINSEKVAVAKHANGRDIWLLTMKGNGEYLAFLISNAGLSTTPVVSNGPAVAQNNDVGYLRVSGDNAHVVAAHYLSDQADILRFNNATGQFTHRGRVSFIDAYGVEFSPNARFVYVGSVSVPTIQRFDLTLPDASLTTTPLSIPNATSNMGALSIGPDGKIYIAASGAASLDVINDPNNLTNVDLVRTSVMLGGRTSRYGLPTFANFFVVPPQIAITEPVDGSSTSDTTPTIAGQAGVGNTVSVTLEDSNGAIIQVIAPAVAGDGTWSFDANALAEGTYTIRATSRNTQGDTTNATPVTFTVDTTAPGLTLDTPTNGTSTNDNTPTITGTGEAGLDVSVTITDSNGAVVQTLTPTVDAQGNWTVDAAVLTDGTYTIDATSADAAGNITSAGPNTLNIDTAPPAITLTTPADGTLTNDNTPAVAGTAEIGSTVSVLIKDSNGATVQTLTPTVDAQGDWTINSPALADGSFTAEATATDTAGNTSAIAGPNAFTVDTTAPAITLTTPVDGTLTNDNTPTVAGSTEVGAVVSVTITDSNGAVVETLTPTVDAQGNWTVDAAVLTDGTYTIDATSADAAGNITSAGPNTLNIDTVGPAVVIAAPADGAQTNDSTPTVSGATEAGAMLVVTISNSNGVVEVLNPAVDAQGNWTIDAAMLTDGTYTVSAVGTDLAGNAGAIAGPNAFTVDTTAPGLTLDTPTNGTSTNDNTPTITGTGEAGLDVSVTITDSNGAVVQTLTPTVDAQGNWTVDAAVLTDGTYTIDATSADAAGNITSAGPNTLNIDTVGPALTIAAPADASVVGDTNVTVSGQSDAGQEVVLEVLDANGVVVDTQTVTTDANGDWSAMVSNLSNGSYTVRAAATDDVGNVTNTSSTFTVDTDIATVDITSPEDNTTTNEVRPVIEGQASSDATVQVVIKDDQGNDVATYTPTVDANGAWSVSPDQDLAEGQYTVEATATRPNNKMATDSIALTIDLTAPVTTITAPADGMIGSMNQPEITGTSEPGAIVDVTVTNTAGTVVFTGQVTADDQGNWSITPDNPLADDTYSVDASSVDVAGNQGTPDTVGFTIDTNAPTVTITSPSNGDNTTDTTPTVSGIAEPGATVIIVIDGTEVGQATADDQGAWSFDVPDDQALDAGDHTIEATTTDDAGNMGSSGVITVTIDEPKAPIVITSPTEGDDVEGPTVTVTGTGEPGDTITVTINGQDTPVTVGDDGSWSTTVDNVPEGENTITVSSGDDSATVTVNVSIPDAASYTIVGGACSSTNSSPTSSLWLLGLLGFGLLRRRKRRA